MSLTFLLNNNPKCYRYHHLNQPFEINQQSNLVLERKCVKLLTYNFFLRPPPVKTNKDDYKDERLEEFKNYMEDFDIICFQEVFGSFSNRKERMIQNAKERGFEYYASGDKPPFFSKFLIDGGLLILSRFPIIDCKKLSYDCGVMSDGMSMKGIVYAKIKLKNSFLCLFTTHLQASYFDSGEELWKFSIKTREEQSEVLINFIYNTILSIPIQERDRCKFLLCGDFNMDGLGKVDFMKKYNLPELPQKEIDTFLNKLVILGKVENLTLKKYSTYPPTFGDNTGNYDKVLTGENDINSKQSLDYIFEIIPDYQKDIYNQSLLNKIYDQIELIQEEEKEGLNIEQSINNKEEDKKSIGNKLSIDYDSTKVEPFVVRNKPFQQLSDHFGVSVEININ